MVNQTATKALKLRDSKQQPTLISRNVAELLHSADLAQVVLSGEDFHLKVENEPYKPLVIEAHNMGAGDRQLYLTHYDHGNGDQWIDAELVMDIHPNGQLGFAETATYNPFTGGEHRAPDQPFANMFSRNLVNQGFGEAAREAYLSKQLEEGQTMLESESGLAAKVQQAQAISTQDIHYPGQSNVVEPSAVEAIMANPPPEPGMQTEALFDDSAYRQEPVGIPPSTIDADGQDPSWGKPSVQQLCERADEILAHPIYQEPEPTVDIEDLRDWYRQANSLGRSPQHLKRIESVGKALKAGQLDAYGPKDEAAREHDLNAYQAQSSNVYAMAKYLLKRIGQSQPDGAIAFQGKTYGLRDQDGGMEVSAQGRGTILAAQAGGTVHSCRLIASDVERFKTFVLRVRQHEQERPVAIARGELVR